LRVQIDIPKDADVVSCFVYVMFIAWKVFHNDLLFIAKNVQKRARECNYPRPVSYFVSEGEREKKKERERDQ